MTFEELLAVDPSKLDKNSTYDLTEHIAFPDLNYVEKETSVNLIEQTRSEEEAIAVLRLLTKMTRDIVFSNIQYETRYKLEFLIAKHEDYRKAFIDMVCAWVFVSRSKGIDSILETGENSIEQLPRLVQVKGKMLFTNQYTFRLTDDQIRSDY